MPWRAAHDGPRRHFIYSEPGIGSEPLGQIRRLARMFPPRSARDSNSAPPTASFAPRRQARVGAMARIRPPRFSEPSRLPETTMVVVTGTDPDGDPIARPATWEGPGPPPLILMH